MGSNGKSRVRHKHELVITCEHWRLCMVMVLPCVANAALRLTALWSPCDAQVHWQELPQVDDSWLKPGLSCPCCPCCTNNKQWTQPSRSVCVCACWSKERPSSGMQMNSCQATDCHKAWMGCKLNKFNEVNMYYAEVLIERDSTDASMYILDCWNPTHTELWDLCQMS